MPRAPMDCARSGWRNWTVRDDLRHCLDIYLVLRAIDRDISARVLGSAEPIGPAAAGGPISLLRSALALTAAAARVSPPAPPGTGATALVAVADPARNFPMAASAAAT